MNAIIRHQIRHSPKAGFSELFKTIGATGGIFFGSVLLITGLALSTLAFFEQIEFDNTELVLIAASFVFIGIGAHCMDLLEKEARKKRKLKWTKFNL